MLYLSLGLISLGIVIFLFSLILDAKRRHEMHSAAGHAPAGRRGGADTGKGEGPAADRGAAEGRGRRVPRGGQTQAQEPPRQEDRPAGAPASRREREAVLFEDKSTVIDYSNESGSIDPSLEKYKNIKRIGSGTISVESGGITFYMGKKLYRYDYHRIRDIKAGKSHLALFPMGSGSVKLFIIESGADIINAATDAFREYVRSSS